MVTIVLQVAHDLQHGATQAMHTMRPHVDDAIDARLASGLPSPAYLYARTPAGDLERIALDRPVMLLGRSRLVDIPRVDDKMAPQHAKLVAQGRKHWLHDLGSGKGTYLNGDRVAEAQLRDGDTIQLGNSHFTYRAAFEPSERMPVVAGEAGVLPAMRADAMLRQLAIQHLASFAQGGAGGAGGAGAADDERVDLQALVAKVRKVFAFFRYYWLVIVSLTVIGGGIGFAVGINSTEPALAEFRIRLTPDAADNPLEMQQRIKFFDAPQEEFRNPDLVRATLQKLWGREVSLGELDVVIDNLTFIREGQSLWHGSYTTAEGPEAALAFLETHVNAYLESEIEKTLAGLNNQVTTLRKELDDTERDLKRIEADRERFQRENIGMLPQQGDHFGRLEALREQRLSIAGRLDRARADLQIAQGKLNDDDSLLAERYDAVRPMRERRVGLRQQMAELEAQGFGRDHPDMISLMAKLEQIDAEIERELQRDPTQDEKRLNRDYRAARSAVTNHSSDIRVLEKELASVDHEISRLSTVVKGLPALETQGADVERSYAANKSHYDRALQRFKSTEMQLRLERDAANGRYHIVTKPNCPPNSPVRGIVLRTLMGLVAGFVVGVALGLMRQIAHYIVLRA